MISLLLALSAAAEDGPALVGCPEVGWPAPVDPVLAVRDQEVVVSVAIAPTGELAFTPISGPPVLVEHLLAALPGCRGVPAAVDGLPVPSTIELRWSFAAVAPNVSGVVLRRGDRGPVAGATVIVGEQSARTDADGRFSLIGVPPGELTLTLRADDVSAPATALNLGDGQALDLTVWAFPEDPDAVLVATYGGAIGTEARVMGAAEARAMPGSLGDPIRALHADPALSRTPFDAGWLLVRGGDWDDTSTFLDGVPVPLLYHLGGFTSVLHPELVGEVRFWPDGAPARFGDGLAGAAEVSLRGPPERDRVSGGVNLVYAEALAEGRLDSGAGFQIGGRRSYLDGVLGAVLGADAARIAPRFYDGAARFTGDGWSVTALGVSDVYDAPTGEGAEIVTITQGGGQLQARFTQGRFSFVPWISERVQELDDDQELQRIVEWYPGFRAEERLGSGLAQGYVGLEGQVHTFTMIQGGDERRAPELTGAPYAAFSAGGRVKFRGGLRADALWLPEQPLRAGLSPQAGVGWQITDALAWKADWGRYHKAPDAVYLVALPDGVYLPMERSDSASTGLRFGRAGVEVGVDGFVRSSRGLAGFEADGTLGPLLAENHGFEATFALHREDVDLSALYSRVEGWRREEPGAPSTLSPYDLPNRLEVVAVGRLPRGLVLSGRFRWTSGYPRRDEAEAYDVLTGEIVQLGSEARLPEFHGLDLKVVRPFAFRSWRLDASLDVLNVYNRRVPEPVITGFGDSDPALGFGLPVLPVFGLSGSYWPRR